jgi:hypothetical protein
MFSLFQRSFIYIMTPGFMFSVTYYENKHV